MSSARVLIAMAVAGLCFAAAGGGALAQSSGRGELIKICSKKKSAYCEYGYGGEVANGFYVLRQTCGMKQFPMADWSLPRPAADDEQGLEHCPLRKPEPVCNSAGTQPGRCEEVTAYGSATVGLGILPYVLPAFADAYNYSLKVEKHERPEGDADAETVYALESKGGDRSCLKLTVSSGLSIDGVRKFISGEVDIGLSSNALTDRELDELNRKSLTRTRVRGEIEHVVGVDALALVVHPKNPVNALGVCDAARILQGAENNWSRFGGENAAIDSSYRRDQAASYRQFRDFIVKACNIEPRVSGENRHKNFRELLTRLSEDPKGLGVVPRAFIHGADNVKRLRIKDACGLELDPTPFNVSAEDYILTRKLYVMTAIELSCAAQRLVRFMESDSRAAQALSNGKSILPEEQTEGRAIGVGVTVEPSGSRLRDGSARETGEDSGSWRQFQSDVEGAARLSSTFRFKPGSSDMDARGAGEILRLASYLRQLEGADKAPRRTLILAGFADSDGTAEACRAKSLERAQAVKERLEDLGVGLYLKEIKVKGYGKILPLACNNKDYGKEKNRRVEAYLTPAPR